MGAHRDGAPFITLLCCDNDGLQVLNPNTSKWINVPYIPGNPTMCNSNVPLDIFDASNIVKRLKSV